MKILLYSDVHWSSTSSIVRQQGKLFTLRLEYLINSMNWVNQVAVENNCKMTICAGDFMHKPTISDDEITALKQVNWADMQHYFLCGNHESSVSNLSFSSVKMLESDHRHIITNHLFKLKIDDIDISFIPYIVESDRLNLDQYIEQDPSCTKHIIISHNDIAGVQYGGYESKTGFSIEEIEKSCDLYLNGHIHNSEWITKKILNLGSLSGHNFTNDSAKYSYGIWILDTETLNMQFIENPFSLNFYKLDIISENNLNIFNLLKHNAVLSLSCTDKILDKCKQQLALHSDNIIDSRFTLIKTREATSETKSDVESLRGDDHIKRLIQFCDENLENTSVLAEELAELCK